MADRDHPKFAIVLTVVRKIQRISEKEVGGIFKIKSALRKRNGTLDRIEGDFHLIIVATNNKLSSRTAVDSATYSAASALISPDT